MQIEPEDDARERCLAVLVAASAGGVVGLGTLLGGLEADVPVPVLVAQHLRRSRETHIVASSTQQCGIKKRLAGSNKLVKESIRPTR